MREWLEEEEEDDDDDEEEDDDDEEQEEDLEDGEEEEDADDNDDDDDAGGRGVKRKELGSAASQSQIAILTPAPEHPTQQPSLLLQARLCLCVQALNGSLACQAIRRLRAEVLPVVLHVADGTLDIILRILRGRKE